MTAPVAIFLLGMPGSGKSSVLKPLALEYLALCESGPVVTRDADEVRQQLPEYSRGLGSHVVQTESVDVTYVQSRPYLSGPTHLLLDMVGDPSWLPREMHYFSNKGYTVVALCSRVPVSVAEQRAKLRAITDGRHVSIEYLRSTEGRPEAALRAALDEPGLVTHWAVVDTVDDPPVVRDGDGRFGEAGQQATVQV